MKRAVTIGLDPPVENAIRAVLPDGWTCLSYPSVPEIRPDRGDILVPSMKAMGLMLKADAIIWHGYFPDADDARRAIALSAVPSFPDIRRTILHDDRVLSLLQALVYDFPGHIMWREWWAKGQTGGAEHRRVVKTGNTHAGTAVQLVEPGEPMVGGLAEPFLEGRDERVLVIGQKTWHLVYELPEGAWKKDARAKAVLAPEKDYILVQRAQEIAFKLNALCVGIDFRRGPQGDHMLECNMYPALDEAPNAPTIFAQTAAEYLGWA